MANWNRKKKWQKRIAFVFSLSSFLWSVIRRAFFVWKATTTKKNKQSYAYFIETSVHLSLCLLLYQWRKFLIDFLISLKSTICFFSLLLQGTFVLYSLFAFWILCSSWVTIVSPFFNVVYQRKIVKKRESEGKNGEREHTVNRYEQSSFPILI